jgi:hypothetical protein
LASDKPDDFTGSHVGIERQISRIAIVFDASGRSGRATSPRILARDRAPPVELKTEGSSSRISSPPTSAILFQSSSTGRG